ncbi:MAG: hypothetical protein HY239_19845 [Mycolicibacterium aromaticivorans]|nr:hypothetical protein [Mycolicibacterium aromaticivorans]
MFGTQHWAGAPMLGSAPNAVVEDLARRVRGFWSIFAHAGSRRLGHVEHPSLRSRRGES